MIQVLCNRCKKHLEQDDPYVKVGCSGPQSLEIPHAMSHLCETCWLMVSRLMQNANVVIVEANSLK